MRIWVAEDDGELRRLIVTVLRKDGHEVRELPDGQALWQALESALGTPELPQLVVSDHAMPRLSGTEVLARLRACEPSLRFILLTAFPSDEITRAAAQHGALLLHKPFDLRNFRETVRTQG